MFITLDSERRTYKKENSYGKVETEPVASASIFKTSVTVFPYTDLPAGK